jgi:hypothetical protein
MVINRYCFISTDVCIYKWIIINEGKRQETEMCHFFFISKYFQSFDPRLDIQYEGMYKDVQVDLLLFFMWEFHCGFKTFYDFGTTNPSRWDGSLHYRKQLVQQKK